MGAATAHPRKARLGRWAVVALVGVFGVTLVEALKDLGVRAPRTPSAPALPVEVSQPLGTLMQQHHDQVTGQTPDGPAPAAEALAEWEQELIGAPPRYAAHEFRDPFEDLLPADAEPGSHAASGPGGPERMYTSHDSTPLASGYAGAADDPNMGYAAQLVVQGVWWGGSKPQAIINDEVYEVGDVVAGATIRTIDRRGVTVELNGVERHLTTRASSW